MTINRVSNSFAHDVFFHCLIYDKSQERGPSGVFEIYIWRQGGKSLRFSDKDTGTCKPHRSLTVED